MPKNLSESSPSKTSHPPKLPQLSTNSAAQFLGSGMAGVIEVGLFHPFDTVIKRWQNHNRKVKLITCDSTEVSKIVFKEAYNKSAFNKLHSLYSGLSFGALYKITQRVYKFGGQPLVKQRLENSAISHYYEMKVGKKHADALLRATAGGIIGIGEALFILPLDALKVKYQTNPAIFKNCNVFHIIKTEKFNLYNGLGWTMARNFPGSFALFGVEAVVKSYIFHVEKPSEAKAWQTVIASASGTAASIWLTNPLDVIKTRIQARSGAVNGFSLAADLVKEEGVKAFFKGALLKLLTQGPKVTASFALSQLFTQWLDRRFRSSNENDADLFAKGSKLAFFSPTETPFQKKGDLKPTAITKTKPAP